MQNDFLLIRSYGSGNALARVQSDPLVSGLKDLNQSAEKLIYAPGAAITIEQPKYLLVSYDDTDALLNAQEIKRQMGCKIICLGSDIYNLDRYVAIAEIADLFVMPTLLHKEILQSAVWVDVIVVPESVDSIALPQGTSELPVQRTNQICWFGYPESFDKAFKYIFNKAVDRSRIPRSQFGFITSSNVTEGIPHIPFHENTFYEVTRNYSHTLLSHFVFDGHINSYAKSPNKLITSLVRGMVPLVSKTKHYEEIMRHYNLESLMFANGHDLVELLRNLDAERDHNTFDIAAISNDLQMTYSPQNNAHIFLNAIG